MGLSSVLSLTDGTKVTFMNIQENCTFRMLQMKQMRIDRNCIQTPMDSSSIHKRGWWGSLRFMTMLCTWFGVSDGCYERSETPPLRYQEKSTRYSRQRKTSLNIENPNNHLRFTIDWPFPQTPGFLLSSSQKIQSDVAGYYIHHKRNEQRWQFWVLATSSELVSEVCNIQRIQAIDIIIRVVGKEKETARTL